MNVTFNFQHVNLRFENTRRNKERLEKISFTIFDILEEKLKNDDSALDLRAENINFDNISIPSIIVNPEKSDYQIAHTCASSIYFTLVKQLR